VSFRLPQAISFWEVKQVEALDVEIRTNTCVGKDITANEILESFDFVVLAVGMANVPNIGIPGENNEHVYDAIQFVKETKTKEITQEFVGKRVAVIGAGNTAIDAATCSIRLGADNVKILYRRSQEEMTAYNFEYDFAKQDGVEFRWLTAPKRIVSENGKLIGIECMKMELGELGDDGRRQPIPVKDSEFVIEVDAVIKAIGQARHLSLIEQLGLEHAGGVVKVDKESYQTSNPKVFACGDVVFGKGQGEAMVVTAAQQGKLTALSIHKQTSQVKTV
jgi:glutamate synthase (NADPH/NADH) small chain